MTEVASDEEDVQVEAAPWSWVKLAGIAATAVGNAFNAVALACDEVSAAVTAHLAYSEDRRGFAASVLADVDKIAAGLTE